jgi:hypothetical protein
VGFWIRVGGRPILKTVKRSGSDSNAGCGAGFNMTHLVSSRCWCATTLSPGVEVRVFIDRRYLADGVDVTHCVLSATRELFCEDVGVVF